MERMIDCGGRVTIPKEVRKQLNIRDNDYLELTIENNAIVLKPKEKTILDIRRATRVHIDVEKVKEIKEKYKPGDKVKLLNMATEAYLVPRGTIGEVVEVDDLGSVFVKWENNIEIAILNINGDAIEKC